MNDKVAKAIEKGKFAPLRKMAEGRDESVRVEAVRGMGSVPGEDSFNYLTNALRSPAPKVRAAAAEGLGVLKDSKARAFVEHQMQAEPEEEVRDAMRQALAALRETH